MYIIWIYDCENIVVRIITVKNIAVEIIAVEIWMWNKIDIILILNYR